MKQLSQRTVYILPGASPDFGELAVLLHVVGRVHFLHIKPSRCPQDFDNLDHLVHLRVAHERRRAICHFHNNAARRPHVDLRAIVGGSEDELRGSVAARTDVCQIGLSFISQQLLGVSCLAEPKSEMMSLQVALSTSIFWGLMSRCAMPSMAR